MTPREATQQRTALLESALHYARRGWPVFPLYSPLTVGGEPVCSCPKGSRCPDVGKHPQWSRPDLEHGLRDATTDDTRVQAWWARWPDANVALVTGVHSFWVLDIDRHKGGEESLAAHIARYGPLPETVEQLTGAGRHLCFRHPGPAVRIPPTVSTLGPGLDVRGDGAYIVAAPSRHRSGRFYQWEVAHHPDEIGFSPAPAWLLERVIASSNGARPHAEPVNETIPEGQRNAVLTSLAGTMRRRGMTVDEILVALQVVNARRCRPPLGDAELRSIAASVGHYAPADPPGDPTAEPASTAAPGAGEAVLVRLQDVAPEPVDWLWPGRIPRGKLTLLIGEPGDGKTTVATDVAARVSTGAVWPDRGRAPAGGVVLSTAEDGIGDTIRPRIDRQGGDPTRVYILRGIRRPDGGETAFTLEHDLPALERAILDTQAVLVGVDPLSAYLGGKDSYKDSEIRAILSPLAMLAERLHVAILAILHLTKAAQRRVLLRAQGSVAFVAQARCVFAVGRDPELPERRLLVPLKNNLGPLAPTLAFRIDDGGLTWDPTPIEGSAERLLSVDEVASRSEQRERDAAATFLRDVLAGGPTLSKHILADARANGIAQRTLWRAKADLRVLAERAKGQTGAWYWMLPREEGPP